MYSPPNPLSPPVGGKRGLSKTDPLGGAGVGSFAQGTE